MANTTQFTFIDLLLAKVRALPACAAPVIVFDGLAGPELPMTGVSIGAGEPEPPAFDGQETWAGLGHFRKWEEYSVNVRIWAWVGGDASSGTTVGDAQATARNNAKTVFYAIEDALVADVNFATANGGTPLVLYCGIDKVVITQTPVAADDDGSRGRQCDVRFSILVRAQIQSS